MKREEITDNHKSNLPTSNFDILLMISYDIFNLKHLKV